MSIQIYPMRPRDLYELGSLRAGYTSTYGYRVRQSGLTFSVQQEALIHNGLNDYYVDKALKRQLEALLRGNKAHMRIARRDTPTGNGAVGMCVAVPHPDREHCADLRYLWIDKDSRGIGVGTRLWAEMVSAFKGTGITRINIETQDVNGPAISFYLKMGATITGCDTGHYTDGVSTIYLTYIL